jgi:hypothetical protein
MSLLQPRNVPHFPPQTTPLVTTIIYFEEKNSSKKEGSIRNIRCKERENSK